MSRALHRNGAEENRTGEHAGTTPPIPQQPSPGGSQQQPLWYTPSSSLLSSHHEQQQQHQHQHQQQQQQQQSFRLNSVIRRDSREDESAVSPHSSFFYRPPAAGFPTSGGGYYSGGRGYSAGLASAFPQQQQHSNQQHGYAPYNGNFLYSHHPVQQHKQQQQEQQQLQNLSFLPPYGNQMFPAQMFSNSSPFIMGARSDTTPTSDCVTTPQLDGAISGAKAVAAASEGISLPPGRGAGRGHRRTSQAVLATPLPAALMAAIQQQEELPELELELGVFEVSPEKLLVNNWVC